MRLPRMLLTVRLPSPRRRPDRRVRLLQRAQHYLRISYLRNLNPRHRVTLRMPHNSTVGTAGRLCNHIIRNLAASFIAEKGDLRFEYSFKAEMDALGLKLYEGKRTYDQTHFANDTTFMSIIEHAPSVNFNLVMDVVSAQTPQFSAFLYNHFAKPEERGPAMYANFYRSRYNTNNDVFLHVRLGDAAAWSAGYEYFDTALSRIKFTNGYLASDSKDHPIVQRLLKKWNLTFLDKDEVETIMFGSTCRHLILSHGTFSYIIGLLGFFSDIYVPPDRYNTWCGKIFDLPGWNRVEFAHPN